VPQAFVPLLSKSYAYMGLLGHGTQFALVGNDKLLDLLQKKIRCRDVFFFLNIKCRDGMLA